MQPPPSPILQPLLARKEKWRSRGGLFRGCQKYPAAFSVVEKGIYIEVLGTHFNVNGYDDETFSNTTLLEGAVKVSYQKVGALLRPGMQAQVYRGPNPDSQVPAIKVGPANVEQAVAWKNGLFSFAKADLPTVLRQLSRLV